MKLELTKERCDDYLEKYLEIGYKNSKVFSIKEGAYIGKYARMLKNNEPKEQDMYITIFRILEIMNKNSAFTLGDASMLDLVMNFCKNYKPVQEQKVPKQVPEKQQCKEDEETKCKEI